MQGLSGITMNSSICGQAHNSLSEKAEGKSKGSIKGKYLIKYNVVEISMFWANVTPREWANCKVLVFFQQET